jgi:hypothetical protein
MKNDFDGTFDNFNNPDTPLNSTSEQFRLGFSQSTSTRRVCVEVLIRFKGIIILSIVILIRWIIVIINRECQCGCIQQIFF